jgi:small-conductance mechanosensitive channel
MPIGATFHDWSEATLTSLGAALALIFAAVPKIIGFVLILLIGWFVASLIQRGVAGLARAVHFNNLARRSGFSDFVQRMGIDTDASGFLGQLAKWFIRLIALIVAFDALGLPAVSDVLRQLLLWLPNVVVALVVLVIGGIAANALANLVRASTSEAGFSSPDMIAKVARVSVWAFAIVVAVNQLGIAETLVNTLFMAVVGAAALAFGLAFGLGGRDAAADMVRRSYHRAREARPRIERAAQAAGDIAANQATPPLDRRASDRPAFGDD